MFDDYFPTLLTGPKAKKDQSQLSTDNHYCFRYMGGNYHLVVYTLKTGEEDPESKYDQDVYSKENPVAKIYQTYEMPPEIAGEIFNVEVLESVKTNRISYIYVPVLNGIPMVFNKIEIQFDAKGLYKIKSFAPYSVEEIGSSDLKSSEDVISEVRAELKNDEIPFDTREIVYTIEKDGTARMKYIFADKKEKLIKTVSMEADYEK